MGEQAMDVIETALMTVGVCVCMWVCVCACDHPLKCVHGGIPVIYTGGAPTLKAEKVLK